MIDHGHPHCHIHEVEMMDHVKRSIAASYTSLLSRIDSHIEDNRVHVSAEEKDTWNNKADKTQIRDLEMRLMEKADYCDVIELKEILAKIKAKVENTSENGSGDGSDYITESELNRILEETKESIIEDIAEKIQNGELDIDLPDINNYYTKSEIYNKSEIDQKISQIPTQPGSGSVSVSYQNLVPSDAQGKYQIGNIVINGVPTPVYQKDAKTSVSVDGKTIVVDGVPYDIDTDTSTTTGIAADQIRFVQNPLLPTTGNDAYKIGDFIVADTTYPIYGKDVIVSTENSQQSAEPSNPVQFLTYPLIRISTWNSAGNYNNGEESEGGIKYIDVVEHNGVYYKCTVAHTTSEPGVGNGWEKFAIHDDAYINTLIAENAYIQSLTAKQIVVTDNNNKPVAGMLNGIYIPTELGERTNNNGIRIFAGNVAADGDMTSAAFTVNDEGKVRAGSGSVVFNADGSGSMANGNITWDVNGNVLIRGLLQVGSKVMEMLNNVTANITAVDVTPTGITVYVTVVNPNDYAIQASGYFSVDGDQEVWSTTGVLPTMSLGPNTSESYAPITIGRDDIPNYDSSISATDREVTINAWHYVDI